MREDGMRWASSSLFFHCVERLSLRAHIYYIPAGVTVTPSELLYYTGHLKAELRALQDPYDSEACDYVKSVCRLLEEWAEGGHSVHVV
jgi:hypothetical protein